MHMNTKYIKFIPIAALLLCGIFSARAQTPPTPGGLSGYILDLWADGDNYNQAAQWSTRSPLASNVLAKFSTNAPTSRDSEKFNFHKEMFFGNTTSDKLATFNITTMSDPFPMTRDQSYYIFVVSDAEGTTGDQVLFTFNGSATTANLRWNTSATNIMSSYWTTTQRSPNWATPAFPRYGIAMMNVGNSANGNFDMFLNGNKWSTTLGPGNNTTGGAQYNVNMLLGNASPSATTGNTNGFNGSIQEIIIMRKSAVNSLMPPADIAKVQTYLAIKYGISVLNGNNVASENYIISDGTPVWSRNLNTNYNNFIFGIGRDNASGLNQVQSRCVENQAITIYKGTLNALNNNASTELADKTFLMLGSNRAKNSTYDYPAGTPFNNGSITEKINYYGSVYKAQVTGTPGPVNIRVRSTNARYILVSSSATFSSPATTTRIYEINNLTAENVVINNNEYLALSGYEASPGGISMSNYNLDLWIDGNNSDENMWPNLAESDFALQQFSNFAPTTRNSKFNFHRELFFGNAPSSKLRTTTNYGISPGQSYHVFVVSDARGAGTTSQVLYTFNNSAGNTSMRWNLGTAAASVNNVFATYWTTTERPLNTNTANRFPRTNFPYYGITSMNVLNTNSQSYQYYFNGVGRSETLGTTAAAGAATNNVPLLIGNASPAVGTATTNEFNGAIQEMIFIRRPAGASMLAADVTKIHSYLAIKYGIPLINGDNNSTNNYLNSDGTVIWDRVANSTYNNNIFGIARDDHSGLYQKQSRSTEFNFLTVHVGDAITTLNSENNGTLPDKQYLLIGRADYGPPVSVLVGDIEDGDEYENGFIESEVGFNIQSAVYKSQITGPLDAMTVKMTSPANDFSYVLVSTHNMFDNSGNRRTKIFPVNMANREVIVDLGMDANGIDDYKFFKFVGYAPGPGGVNPGLLLWLKADDDASIILENIPLSKTTAGNVQNYPGSVADPENVPAVSEWHDYIRSQTYSWAAGTSEVAHRYPVMVHSSLEMNYYPAVHFWGSGTSFGSYLSSAKGLTSVANPAAHTALFMVNNDFSTNPWIYTMMFGSATGNASYNGPGYGIQRINTAGANFNNMVGRYRTDATEYTGTNSRNLFKTGSTSILNFAVRGENGAANNRTVGFRFNGKEDQPTTKYSFGTSGLDRGSQLGKGYTYDRTIQGYMSEVIFYDRELLSDERTAIESYMALKYGITLTPTFYAGSAAYEENFDYHFSVTDTIAYIWRGQTGAPQYSQFYNRVAAIVRDDAARLNNRHAHSTNAGSLLHLGVAGTELSGAGQDDPKLGNLNNMESVAFGDDNGVGMDFIPDADPCGGFTNRFKRIWLVHKHTRDDRPVKVLVGAQNNTAHTIGNDTLTTPYYDVLSSPGYDVFMIIGGSPDSIRNGDYLQVIPMAYINEEFQCSYEFWQNDTYITFGYRQNDKGCVGDDGFSFPGTKVYQWTNWTSQTNRSNNTGLTIRGTGHPIDLGDNIRVDSTVVTYPSGTYSIGARAGVGYPRSVNTPERGSLQVRRQGGNMGTAGEVVVKMYFNHPVVPSFSITDLDAPSTSYEEVEIIGECHGTSYSPTLSYAGNPNTARYTINGRTATVKTGGNVSPTDRNGRLDVAFRGGVTSITIKYRYTRAKATSIYDIYITPITLRMVPVPPPINEDGFSFVKDVNKRDFFTCEPVVYSFEIQNTNCDPKEISFNDTLPAKMRWELESFGLDSKSDTLNGAAFDPQVLDLVSDDGRILNIQSLWIPGTSTLRMTAIAVFDEDAPSGYYDNSASIDYWLTKNNRLTYGALSSVDKYDIENPNTTISVIWSPRPDPVLSEATPRPSTYRENNEIEVTWLISNTNADIEDLFLNVIYNDEFAYKNNSFEARWVDPGMLEPLPVLVTNPNPLDPNEQGSLNFAGTSNGLTGFTMFSGDLEIKFRLIAPTKLNLVNDVDEFGVNTDDIIDLIVSGSSYSEMEDVCLIQALMSLQFEVAVPYGSARAAIITNSNVTTKIVK